METTSDLTIGMRLAEARRHRRLSQLALAGDTGISTRHLSFVETGRSRPSRELVLRLCETLDMPARQTDSFLLAAGFAPAHRETPLESPAMSEILTALRLLLSRHAPLPAAAFDARWDLVMANEPYARNIDPLLAAGVDPQAGTAPLKALALIATPRPNLLRYLCHPEGARRALRNWPDVTRAILRRVQRDLHAAPAEPHLRPPIEEALAYPGVAWLLREPDAAGALVVPVEFRRPDGGTMRFLTTIATLGTAQDLTLRDVRIETYHPMGDG